MKRSVDNRFRLLGVSMLALAWSVLTSSPAIAQGPPAGLGVKVLNTPLPVQGTVSVGGSVSISGTPNVNVTNTPLAVTITPGEPVNAFIQEVDQTNQVDTTVFTIPAGKRLLVDYVSAKAKVPATDSVSAIFIRIPVVHFLVVANQGTEILGNSVFTAAESLRTAIGPFAVPTPVIVRMERTGFGTSAELAVTLAGQLVDP